MPVELLPFPPSYCIVGAYRFLHDELLWRPIWKRSRTTLTRALYGMLPFTLISYPLTRLYVRFVLARSPFSPTNIHDAAYLGVSVITFTTWLTLLGQVSMALEWVLRREVSKGKEEVYEATVRSRGKGPDFWKPYVEEWSVPPLERAQRNAEKQKFYNRLTSPIIRILILKVLLTPLSFIPFLSLIVQSAIRSLTLARTLHKPYFARKKMTPLEIELFMVERNDECRMFGFVASIMERIPVIGIMFSISNRIYVAHDLEKRQHSFASGEIPRTAIYQSKTAAIAQSDLPENFAGGFPLKKGPVRIGKDGRDVGIVPAGEGIRIDKKEL